METQKSQMTDAERGWAFFAQVFGANITSDAASKYVGDVEKQIELLRQELMKISTSQTDAVIGGFVAETWHAGTFNVNAAAAGSKSTAEAGKPGTNGPLGRNNYGSVDISVNDGNGNYIDYGSKYYANAQETAKQQAWPHQDTNEPKYSGQRRLVPSDQLDEVKEIAAQRANNPKTKENWRKGYQETAETATDTITDGKIKSKPLSKGESEQLARDIRKDDLDLEENGVSTNEAITPEYMLEHAMTAGISAAAVTMLLQTAPEIFKAIKYLVDTGELDIEQLKKIGQKALTSSAEGFLRGSIACYLQILCEKGVFGAALKTIDSTLMGTFVAFTLETMKNCILVAAGKMTPKEMGVAFSDGVVISTGYLAAMPLGNKIGGAFGRKIGSKISNKIGGVIGQALGAELPWLGYLIGSLIGCAFSVVYNFGKRKLISFCVDTGFTCFGLVEQDYTLPEDVLREMGIDFTPITRTEINYIETERTPIETVGIERTEFSTIEIKMVRRGLIGVNKIGYVM